MKKYRDHYFMKAKQDNYPARSVYKLQEIDKQFKILRPGMKVMDLGAAPGSWTLFAAKMIKSEKAEPPAGCVLAADIQSTETNFPGNVVFMQEDVFERSPEFQAEIEKWAPFDVIISDMAPKTTGHKFTDQARSQELCEEALAVAVKFLKKGGSFVVKIFMGPDTKGYADSMRPLFDKVKSFKPKSSRPESKEIFYIGIGYKGLPEDISDGASAE